MTGIPNAFSNDNFVTANARLSLPIYTSGMISRGIDAAGDALDANRFQEAAFVAEVKLSVAESFVTVLRAQRAVDVATTNAASLEGHRRDVDNLNRRGMVPRNDLLAVEVSLADAQQSELKARNALDVARAAYNRRLGRPLDSPVTLDNVMPSGPSRLSENLETLTVVALEERAELHALDEQASALRHRAEALRARTRPQFAAAIGYTYLENDILTDESFASASVGVTWSPFDGGRSRHAALALSRQAQAVTELHNDAVAQTHGDAELRRAPLGRVFGQRHAHGGDDVAGSRRAAVLDESIRRGALEGQHSVGGRRSYRRWALAPGGDARRDRDERRESSRHDASAESAWQQPELCFSRTLSRAFVGRTAQ